MNICKYLNFCFYRFDEYNVVRYYLLYERRYIMRYIIDKMVYYQFLDWVFWCELDIYIVY